MLIHTYTHLQNRGSLINLWHSCALTQATNLTSPVDASLASLSPFLLLPQPRCSVPNGDTNNSSNTFQIGCFFISSPFSAKFWNEQFPRRTVLVTSETGSGLLLIVTCHLHWKGVTNRSSYPPCRCPNQPVGVTTWGLNPALSSVLPLHHPYAFERERPLKQNWNKRLLFVCWTEKSVAFVLQ